MFEKYALIQALKVLLADPTKLFSVRGLALEAGISPSSAKACLDYAKSAGMVSFSTFGRAHQYKANLESPLARQWKILYALEELESAGVAEKLKRAMKPLSITLYGSFAAGTEDKKSDVDLLVIANSKTKVSLSDLEAQLGREINVLIQTPFEWKQKAKHDKIFYEHVIFDSIQLYGKKPVVL